MSGAIEPRFSIGLLLESVSEITSDSLVCVTTETNLCVRLRGANVICVAEEVLELVRAIESFMNDGAARNLSPKTCRRYHDDLDDLTQFLKQNNIVCLEHVTVEHLRSYFAALQTRKNGHRPDQGLSPFTIDGMYRSVKTFFRFCEQDQYLTSDPMRRVRKIKTPKRIVPRLDESQVSQLLDEVNKTQSPERNTALILLLVDSGLRRGEALGLTLDDVYLHAEKPFVRVMGKGRKQRDVPLSNAGVATLNAWLLARSLTGVPQVFVNLDGTPFKAEGVRSLFVRLQIRLGLPRLYPHLLRHTFAELYLKRVKDVKSLQQILGHSKASTTLDLYVEHDLDTLSDLHRLGSPVDAIKKAQQLAVAQIAE